MVVVGILKGSKRTIYDELVGKTEKGSTVKCFPAYIGVKRQELVVIALPHGLAISSAKAGVTVCNRRLLEVAAATECAKHTSTLKFLLEALQRLVNAFVLFYLNDDHVLVLGWSMGAQRN